MRIVMLNLSRFSNDLASDLAMFKIWKFPRRERFLYKLDLFSHASIVSLLLRPRAENIYKDLA